MAQVVVASDGFRMGFYLCFLALAYAYFQVSIEEVREEHAHGVQEAIGPKSNWPAPRLQT